MEDGEHISAGVFDDKPARTELQREQWLVQHLQRRVTRNCACPVGRLQVRLAQTGPVTH